MTRRLFLYKKERGMNMEMPGRMIISDPKFEIDRVGQKLRITFETYMIMVSRDVWQPMH